MFEQLVNEAASRFNLPTASVSAVVRGLLSLMTNERTGGAEGFVDQFRRAGLGDAITSWFGGKEGRPITASNLESALGTTAIDNLASSTGMTRAVVSSVAAYLLPKLIGRLTPNGLLPSLGTLRSQVSNYIEGPAVSAVERKEDRRAWPAWVPWTAAALLALGTWIWFRPPAGTIDPQLTVANRDGKVTCAGLVRDDATRMAIVNTLGTTFGEANVDCSLRVDRNVKRAAWLPRVNDLSAALKVPGAELSLNGDALSLGGWLSASERQALTDRLHGIFGAQATIGSLRDVAAETVRASNDKALSALHAIGTSGVSPNAVVEAMNLAVINFPTGSAEIPADEMVVVRESAEAIKRAPAGARIEIGGHTDNTGDSSSNAALSQARAEAVKNALVAAGAPADVLAAKGYGDTRPRATNDTEYGRFQNRRIEYAVVTIR